jgi:hypothetical protein
MRRLVSPTGSAICSKSTGSKESFQSYFSLHSNASIRSFELPLYLLHFHLPHRHGLALNRFTFLRDINPLVTSYLCKVAQGDTGILFPTGVSHVDQNQMELLPGWHRHFSRAWSAL